jgi:hypothetical protein
MMPEREAVFRLLSPSGEFLGQDPLPRLFGGAALPNPAEPEPNRLRYHGSKRDRFGEG